jgi:hypothetical protein
MQVKRSKFLLFVIAIAMFSAIGNCCKGQVSESAGVSESVIELQKGTDIVFAGVEEGRKRLSEKDEFIKSLSPFDRSARLMTDKPVSEEEFLEYVAEQVMPWTEDEINRLRPVINSISAKLKRFKLYYPQKILLIKTTGLEEGGAGYGRPNAIVIPQNMLIQDSTGLEMTLIHELFHIFTSNNPKLKEALYEVIHFQKCNDIELPEKFREIKLTNPDGIKNDHFVEVKHQGNVIQVVPILYSSAPKYDVTKGGSFFRYLTINLLVVEKTGEKWRYKRGDNNEPVLFEFREVPDYFEKIGFNTSYTFHPDEILAENFVLLIRAAEPVKSQWVIEGMRKILQSNQDKTQIETMDK